MLATKGPSEEEMRFIGENFYSQGKLLNGFISYSLLNKFPLEQQQMSAHVFVSRVSS